MAHGDIATVDDNGQWVNRVEGEPARSASFTSRDEAIDAGRSLAAQSGASHRVVDAEPTGDITDEAI